MCGIIAVVRRPSDRVPASSEVLLALAERAAEDAGGFAHLPPGVELAELLATVTAPLTQVDDALRGSAGVRTLLSDAALAPTLDRLAASVEARADAVEGALDHAESLGSTADLERVNAALVALRDAAWAIRRDRLPTAAKVAELAGSDPGRAAIEACLSIQQVLSAIDRLEVRGRDSAGVHVLVHGHDLDLEARAIRALLEGRDQDPRFVNGAVRVTDGGHLAFVYKAAAEIGELGDNTAAIRAAIVADPLLRLALDRPRAEAVILGHTRWASVGIISEPNAHPVCGEESDGVPRPYVAAALNGDVDNHADLRSEEGLVVAAEITTDAKVIPALTARRLADGHDLDEAFRRTVATLEGSVAIGATNAVAPDQLHLALRGSGQALYVGLTDDAFVVASEPYGLVEETTTYVRMDGETPANPENPTASRGQVLVLDGARAGTLEGIRRIAYDGTELPVTQADVEQAEITTRDIDRGEFPHFLLKEMTEAPGSFRKTLRGRLAERDGRATVDLGPETLPDDLRKALRDGRIQRVLVTGQGTAAVAGQSLAATLEALTPDLPVRVESVVATELSGFELADDMSDTLVVAISQSGTTTDTNRTVDLVRSRGASVVAIVNRRGSDLTDKSDGVLYTSDGRDVEMSVASTKAFYAQVAAGVLLAAALAEELGAADSGERASMLAALRGLPDALASVLEDRERIGVTARELAPSRRYWAVVGNGPNRIAAAEVRIKLSELCYKSIACDVTEDKKHIDLSSEPMILVCAAGLTGSNADDVAKEVAIYRAHKAAPVVIATEGEGRYTSALQALTVPPTHPRLAFVLSAMVGHLFGYEAALAIDEGARPLREARAAIEQAVGTRVEGADAEALLEDLRPRFEALASRFADTLRSGGYDGHLEASTASRASALFRYALGTSPLDGYQAEYGKVGTPGVIVEDLTSALTRAIEELTRPIDAIKHQAKTVTVGISRTDETLLQVPLVREVMAAGAPRDGLTYQALRTLADLDPAIAEVIGWTRYRIEGRPESGDARIVALDRGGVAAGIPTRTDQDQRLRGTKNRVATERQVLVATGRRDGRPIVLVPETKDGQPTGLTLLHVRFRDRISAATARGVLQGYRDRYALLRDAVTETEPTFREDLLAEIDVADLLVASITSLADRFRSES
jgi:glutamine---fructose-6-phosphate transaminase (isomerizing)